MSYVQKRLAPGETIVLKGRFHWMQHVGAWLTLVVLGIFVIGIIMWAKAMYRFAFTEFVVTSRRIVLKQGLFNVDVDEMNLDSIEGSHIDQSLLGRIFGYGELKIHGRGETTIDFPTMARPGEFRSAAEGARIVVEHERIELAAHRDP